jgi:outer membrane protein OmpA-like peptidoglycan-associated protein
MTYRSETLMIFSQDRISARKAGIKATALIVSAAFLLAGCQTQNAYTGEQQTSEATQGALIGGLAGAALGALTKTRGKGALNNALIGAGIGALAGGAVGGYMDNQEAELRDRLRSTGVSVTRQGNNIVLNMQDDILFDVDSAQVNYRSRDILQSVALVLKQYRSTYVNVNGYTDTTGSREHNLDLSQQRAEAVADVLVQNGVESARISPMGFGESDLKVQTRDGVNEPRNRRVEIVLEPVTS